MIDFFIAAGIWMLTGFAIGFSVVYIGDKKTD